MSATGAGLMIVLADRMMQRTAGPTVPRSDSTNRDRRGAPPVALPMTIEEITVLSPDAATALTAGRLIRPPKASPTDGGTAPIGVGANRPARGRPGVCLVMCPTPSAERTGSLRRPPTPSLLLLNRRSPRANVSADSKGPSRRRPDSLRGPHVD